MCCCCPFPVGAASPSAAFSSSFSAAVPAGGDGKPSENEAASKPPSGSPPNMEDENGDGDGRAKGGVAGREATVFGVPLAKPSAFTFTGGVKATGGGGGSASPPSFLDGVPKEKGVAALALPKEKGVAVFWSLLVPPNEKNGAAASILPTSARTESLTLDTREARTLLELLSTI